MTFLNGSPAGRPLRRAFTLFELLLALAVTTIVMALLFHLSASTASVVQKSRAKIDLQTTARSAMDRMSLDLAAAVLRPDLPPLFVKNEGNDAFYFYATADGYEGDRGISAMGYRIDGNEGHLYRGAEGTGWAQQPLSFSSHLASTPFVQDHPNPNFGLLGMNVFRMEIEFLMRDGTYQSVATPAHWEDVQSLIVTILSIDPGLFQKAQGSPGELAALFPDPPADADARALWAQILKDPAFLAGSANFSTSVLGGIKIRQRAFRLSP